MQSTEDLNSDGLELLAKQASSLELGDSEQQQLQQEAENLPNQQNGHQKFNPENINDRISDADTHLSHSSISLASSAAARGATKVCVCVFYIYV